MMKFKIHFTKNGVEDYFIIKGKDIKEVKRKVDIETKKRGLLPLVNNLWSEEL